MMLAKRNRLKIRHLLVVIVLYSFANSAFASMVEDKLTEWQTWPVIGQANLSWLWLDIYSSQLRTPSGQYEQGSDLSPHPLALEIEYQRDISSKQLVESTAEKWQKLKLTEQQVAPWLVHLSSIFPSVTEGDRLIYTSDGQQGAFIFHPKNGVQAQVGTVVDEALNEAFLAIWLSPQTQYPHLRKQLIGMQP
ncbi:chalcone isomerase family protein [Vibrio ordalii]|uniref:chalcone isomerase family protein n=1 Tax=Vibrio ordalii TaxID=28174 RepID=UPI0002482EC7|nr:chalcone isomerase family protein [Vibrio ordalii]